MRKGFTLLENLVSMTLLTMVMVLSWQVMTPCLQVWQVNRARADTEQTAVLLEYRMTRELQDSDPTSLSSAAAPPALSFLSFGGETQPGGYDSTTGKPVWRKYIIYYLDTTNNILFRKEWPNTKLAIQVPVLFGYAFPMQTPKKMAATDLQAVCTTENGTETRAAYYVNSITITPQPPQDVQLFFQLTSNEAQSPQTMTRQVQLQMRN